LRRKEFESGSTGLAQSAGKFFLVVSLHFFVSKSTISGFGERFRNGQYSLVSFLFAILLLTVPRALWSRRHWLYLNSTQLYWLLSERSKCT